ncbi:DUF429 domain-containing protein [Acidimicrobiaceae bacterium USS-CC1]|uniref:DUF429 domain-containing protein n=1 Tax=Acidiferrimicrobium australe TaxID=2664430 RepID=A0ABW9QR93_9ACTN|nr:DUF429 domain-containing protein [Acidiferrimicrobium australe]
MIVAGVDVAEERKGLDLVLIDVDRRILGSFGRLTVADVVSLLLREHRPDLVCVDSPSGWSRSGASRRAERELAAMGISAFATGADPGDHPFYRWMRVGFRLFRDLAASYPLFAGGALEGRAAEVYPHASAVLLAGRDRAEGETKVAFRRSILRSQGVDEVTLPNGDRVDAALAALTGVHALEGHWTCVGDPAEGVVLLPIGGGLRRGGGRHPQGQPGPVPGGSEQPFELRLGAPEGHQAHTFGYVDEQVHVALGALLPPGDTAEDRGLPSP